MGVTAYFVCWVVGCVTMMLIWYFSDVEDHSPYRRGYRDALFDMMKDHVLAREMARRIERETREDGDAELD